MLYFAGIVLLFQCGTVLVRGQFFINQPPHFLAGLGDMSRFSLPENTQLGSPVYQLKGIFVVFFFHLECRKQNRKLVFMTSYAKIG